MVDSSTKSMPKYGFSTFQPTDPVKRYLKYSEISSLSGGCPESPVGGSLKSDIDPETGERHDDKSERHMSGSVRPQSPTYAYSGEEVSSYDDPPNEKEDCPGTFSFTATLTDENTIDNVISITKSKLPQYSGNFTEGNPIAYRDIWEDKLGFSYGKVKYQWKWDDGTNVDSRHSVSWLVVFRPKDNPETPQDESVENMEIVGSPLNWNGQSDQSPVFELDPDTLKSGKAEGSFFLLPIQITDIQRDTSIPYDVVNRVPINVSKSCTVTIGGTLPSGKNIDLTIEATGTGAATLEDGFTSMQLTSSTTVKINGLTNSGSKKDIKLVAKFNNTEVATKKFTVSTWPKNFTQDTGSSLAGGVIQFTYKWESESGNVGDLNKIWIGEHVTYSDGGNHVGSQKPWKGNNPDPTVTPDPATYRATGGNFTDTHSPPGGLPKAGPADTYTATQYYGFHDFILDPTPNNDTLAWQTTLTGPIVITRMVYWISPTNTWEYRIEKSGTSNTATLP